MPRAKAFSGKKKKEQLQARKNRKQHDYDAEWDKITNRTKQVSLFFT